MSNSLVKTLMTTATGRSIVSAGIYTNCDIDLAYEAAKNKEGKEYKKLAITVTTDEGSTKSFNILTPSKAYPLTLNGVMESEKEALFRARVKNLEYPTILVKLVDGNDLANLSEDLEYDEFMKELIKIFNSNKEKYAPKFNVKIVMDKNYAYTELSYANSCFELYKEGKESKLKLTPKDRIVAPKVEENDLIGSAKSDDLPF